MAVHVMILQQANVNASSIRRTQQDKLHWADMTKQALLGRHDKVKQVINKISRWGFGSFVSI